MKRAIWLYCDSVTHACMYGMNGCMGELDGRLDGRIMEGWMIGCVDDGCA